MATVLSVVISAVWLGMVIGVSFVATPIKFTAPTLDYGPALDVGRVTFALFTRLEWPLAVLTAAAVVMSKPGRGLAAVATALVVIVLAQSIWLLPELNQRVAAILDGRPLAPSSAHVAYGVLEAVKALLLLAIIAVGGWRLGAATAPRSD